MSTGYRIRDSEGDRLTFMTPAPSTYREVAALIRDRIKRGEYPRGSALPLQEDLADEFGVTQSMVSRAIKTLAAEGVVQPIRGRRTIVTAIPPIHRNPSIRYSRASRERAGGKGAYDAEIRSLGLTPGGELRVERVIPPANVAEILGVSADEVLTVVRARVMTASDGETTTTTQLADSYIPLEIAADTVLEQDDEGVGGMVSRMAELGYAQVRVTESITGRPATAEEARALGISEDQH